MSKKNRNQAPAGEFVELTREMDVPPPRAEEFLSFPEYWARSKDGKSAAGRAGSGARGAGDVKAGDNEFHDFVAPAGSAEPDGARARGAGDAIDARDAGDAIDARDAGDATDAGEESAASSGSQEPPPPDPVAEARREAEEIISQAGVEAERLQQEAREQGRAEGEKQGRSEAKKQYQEQIAQLKKMLAEIQAQRGALIQNYREELLTLVRAMVERLVHHEVSTNPEVIKTCLQKARKYVVENSAVKAHVNPEDFASLREEGLRNPALLGGKNRIELVEDPAVGRGGCLLKSPFGEVDATRENASDKIYQAVEQAFAAALGLSADQDEPLPAEEELTVEWESAESAEETEEGGEGEQVEQAAEEPEEPEEPEEVEEVEEAEEVEAPVMEESGPQAEEVAPAEPGAVATAEAEEVAEWMTDDADEVDEVQSATEPEADNQAGTGSAISSGNR